METMAAETSHEARRARPSLLPTPYVDQGLLERLARRAFVAGAREMMPVRSPFTGEPLAHVPLCTPEDVEQAVLRARAAQTSWAGAPWSTRKKVLLRLHDLILKRQDEILDVIQLESGKSRPHAYEEVADVAIVCRYYAHHGRSHLKPRRRRGALPLLTATWEYHHPRGVVGFISPWNYPLTLAVTDALPALLAGNAVVLKPDRQTPFSALWASQALEEAGLPADLFQVVTGAGSKLGGPLIEHVNYIGFTGSTATGRTIAEQAGKQLIGASLELGGKNPMLVLADANLEAAARGAVRGCFANAGQLCISIERLYIHSSVYDPFVTKLVEDTQKQKLGAALSYDMDIGSLSSDSQLAVVSQHVGDAVSKGARVLAGGRPRPDLGPLFYEPTILEGVEPGMDVYNQETFGPVVSLYRFDTEDEGVERANATNYGLNASIWSRDTRRARRLATRIQAGTVNVNEEYAATWASLDAPMGGYKDSGLGRRHGREGILKYTESQTVAVQRLMPIAAPEGVSQATFSRFMTSALKILKRLPGLR
jgi:succinate-semialdehyde dehydrogenase / glutarate-semialdehyde dehydrogenase